MPQENIRKCGVAYTNFSKQLQKIYQKASNGPSASVKPRQLTEFWQDYCIWISKCKNLEDSQSQREYWDAKEEFKNLNRAIKKDLNQNQIPWAQFQPPIPTTTQYLNMITDLVKFQFHHKQWEPQVALIYKLFYAVIARPTFLVLGLVALYIKLLLVSRSLAWIQQLTFDLPSVWKSLVDNPFYLITFLGLANNIAGLYGIPSTEERQAFYENHRIHEYDFINALMHEFDKQKCWKGFWNVTLYTVGVNSRDLNDIFWESIYNDNPNIFDEDEVQIDDNNNDSIVV
ncbi:2827_t:CDS:2 [Racocetra fulgida]|uniref:2827_t:CDS:1 n=1 Tax=Racocetra fulgida TaxID=60492 RepID=A0A9N9BHL4_9GLOM|nr:2827_t:CDS:2 [Racocetra fulgida]